MTALVEVVITAPDPEWLIAFSRKLVENRLCAIAHSFAPVQSVYRWRGDVYQRTEGRVSLHTRRDRVAAIVDGWYLVTTKGSHRQYKHPVKAGRVTVAGKPSDTLHPRTERRILRQAQIERRPR
jgi:predicted RNA binding protein YcfA (HicA-like mRNA interferase family)